MVIFSLFCQKIKNQMKKIIFAFATTLLLMSCSEKKSEANTVITGNVKGLSNGTLYLQRMNDSSYVSIDSVKIDGDSNFKFNLNLESPELLYLVLDRGITSSIDNKLPFFAEIGKINIDTDLKYFFSNAKITGSKNHELYEEFEKVNTNYKSQILEISKEKFDALRFNRLKDVDSIDQKINKRMLRKFLYIINFAMNNKDYEVSPYVALSELTLTNSPYLDTIQKNMPPKIAASKYGKILTEYVQNKNSKN